MKTYLNSTSQIEKMDLESGQLTSLTGQYKHVDFTVSNVASDGLITGTVNTYNYNSFFYSQGNQLEIVDPLNI